jgi:hypothetical protein
MTETTNWTLGNDFKLPGVEPHEVKGGFAIQDPTVTAALSEHLQDYDWVKFLKNDGRLDELQKTYINTFTNWIESSVNNNVLLGEFKHATITNGTSESFQMFMQRHNHRTFKLRRGEFMMHKITANNMNLDWAYLWETEEQEGIMRELTPHDAVILSLPYSNTCSLESMYSAKQILTCCNNLNIPVLLDLAYFGTTTDIELDLTDPIYNCVEDVVFSLGKTFPLIGARPGIRFQRTVTDDAVYFANQHGIVNNFACVAGIYAMNNFSADYIYNKYANTAEAVANALDATLSKSVLFATSLMPRYDSIKRVEHEPTRLCISNLITRIQND